MQIVPEFPPNYAEIIQVFNLKGLTPVFTYGHTLYAPYGSSIPPHLMVHERVHEKQQLNFTGGVEAWWKRYLTDKQFRLEQEIEAYQEQFAYYRRNFGREAARKFLMSIASDLSGNLYGNMVTLEHAKELILKGSL